jgi:hypothetical protein
MERSPDRYNTRAVGASTFGRSLSGLTCANETIRWPAAPQFRPQIKYCAVKFEASQWDRVAVTVRTVDSYGTDLVRAYLFDDRLAPGVVSNQFELSVAPLASASYEGDHNGNNRGAPIVLTLQPPKQLEKSGTYWVVFTRFDTRADAEDTFSVRVDGVRAAELPTAARPPIKTGLYAVGDRRYFVDVTPPPAERALDLAAWSVKVTEEKTGCSAPPRVATFSKLVCERGSCWFGAPGWWIAPRGDDRVEYYIGPKPVSLEFVRGAPAAEQRAYATANSCVIRCPAPPPTPSSTQCDAGCRRTAWLEMNGITMQGRCPLVFNVTGGKTVGFLGRGVDFDMDGTGLRPTDWIAPEHPFLALDRNENGVIDDGRELFGSTTILATGETALDGFVALAEFDANGDGKIDRADPIYERLLLWFDRDSNGKSEPTELVPLRFGGVRAISLLAKSEPRPTAPVAFTAFTSTFEEYVCNYRNMVVADVWFPTTKPRADPPKANGRSVPQEGSASRSTRTRELDAGPEVTEAARLEAAGRAGFDDPAALRPVLVDSARVLAFDGEVERAAAVAVVADEPEPGRPIHHDREASHALVAEACFVGLEELDRVRPVVATAAAGDAIGAFGIGRPLDRRERHEWDLACPFRRARAPA